FPESLEELRRAKEFGSRDPEWMPTPIRWEAEIRQTERMAEIAPRLPAVLNGRARPQDASEALDFARLCATRHLHAAAPRLYDTALKADPKQDGAEPSLARFEAIASAARAGAGRARDEPTPDDAERARLRDRCRGWLKSELAAWSNVVATGSPEARSE